MGNHYTAQRFIAAIPGTGGIVSALADRVGCDWHTAKKYIEEYATVGQAWSAERNKVTDKARHNIVKGIQGGDHQLSKWWLQSMDDDFIPKQKTEITGVDGGPIQTEGTVTVDLSGLTDEDLGSLATIAGRVAGD